MTDAGVECRVHADLMVKLEVAESPRIVLATAQDFSSEFSSKVVAIMSVDGVDEAIKHINTFGSKHTDCIITENKHSAKVFMERVDSAGVYWNVSTRFADGFRLSGGGGGARDCLLTLDTDLARK